MKDPFIAAIKMIPNTTTANGAGAYTTTLNANLDLFSSAGSMRFEQQRVCEMFMLALNEDVKTAVRNLVYIRHIRAGMGERRTFRAILMHLIENDRPDIVELVLSQISQFGRWDDATYVLGQLVHKQSEFNKLEITSASRIKTVASVKSAIFKLISNRYFADVNCDKNYMLIVSLLGKWLPSLTSDDPVKAAAARWLAIRLHAGSKKATDKQKKRAYSTYRKNLVFLRKRLEIVETKLTTRSYDRIVFTKLPSKALFKYRASFDRNMNEAYNSFLNDVESGKAKLNAKLMQPHELVRSSRKVNYLFDRVIEETWKSLPREMFDKRVMVMADTSGSMTFNNSLPYEVAAGLAIYTSELLPGCFKNSFMTFSRDPKLFFFKETAKFHEKLREYTKLSIIDNTDILAGFRVMLKVAVEAKLSPDEMPEMFLVISDMEFDRCNLSTNSLDTIHQVVGSEYRAAGYSMPKIVFWNVNASGANFPVREGQVDTAMVSGFSTSILKYILTGEIKSPIEVMLETLNREEFTIYDAISQYIK